MKRRRIVRIQIFLLVVVTGLLIVRAIIGPPAPGGLIVFADLRTERLRHEAFTLDVPASFFVEAVGSFETTAPAGPLAAYGWILSRDTREIAWRMDPTRIERDNGTLARVRDSLRLPAGVYDVFFTTYGSTPESRRGASFLGLKHHWTNDEDDWQMTLTPAEAAVEARVITGEKTENLAPDGPGLVWTAAPANRRNHTASFLFQTTDTLTLNLYAVGEICDEGRRPCDYGRLENAASGERIWEMRRDNTRPAGGWSANRRFRGDVTLAPGVYRASFETDGRHHYDHWRANPPYDPAAWGLTLHTANPAAVTAFDPWRMRRPLILLTEVPNDALRTAQFVVTRPLRLIVYALGEISDSGSPYDYAWIEDNVSGRRIWEMTRDASQYAGSGESSNRVEIAFLKLDPGTYTLAYQTDGSHAFGDWRNGEPPHSERWGVTLFPFSPRIDTTAFRLLEPAEAAEAPSTPPLGTGELLFQKTRLGNDVHLKFPFELDKPTRLHIYALGEISASGSYDYGWIERADTGETVWKMTLPDTEHAGGDERNRRFDGVITLPPGSYILFFKTDFSHAYGDFDGGAPDTPEDWGITIERLDD
jgi:hypothetical protein